MFLKRFSSRIKESLFSFPGYPAHNISSLPVALIQKLALFFSDNAVIGLVIKSRHIFKKCEHFRKVFWR